jgi:hypothetical protein
MTKSRYVAASIAQYLHEMSGRHADERAHAHDEHPARPADTPHQVDRVIEARMALAGR